MTHNTFENLDCTIHYWHKKGNGKRFILFFHGAGCDHRMFEPQIDAFDDSDDLVFWDARGHGLSKLNNGRKFTFDDMVSDCLKLYEVLGIKKAVIVGQSMGGNLAQRVVYHHPGTIEKLVLIGCTRNTGKLTMAEKMALKMSGIIFTFYPWKALVGQSARACGNKAHVQDYVRECFEKLEKPEFIDIITQVTGCLHEDADFKFKQPVLLICGADDKSGNIKKAMKAWANDDPNCTLHMIENAGHNANQDEPEIVNEHVLVFLNQES